MDGRGHADRSAVERAFVGREGAIPELRMVRQERRAVSSTRSNALSIAHRAPQPVVDSEQIDHTRFTAVAALFRNLNGAASTPTVLILDDLHDADPRSLAILRFFVRGLRDTRTLVIATYREAEVQASPTFG